MINIYNLVAPGNNVKGVIYQNQVDIRFAIQDNNW